MKRADSFAAKVREALAGMGRGATFRIADLCDRVGVRSRRDRERVGTTLRDMLRRGEVRAVPGEKWVYEVVGRSEEKPSKKKVMWDYARMRKKCGSPVTVEELQEVSAASADYVREWLRSVVRLGAVRDLGDGRYQLVQGPVALPDDGEKAARLRELRAKRKALVVEALTNVHAGVFALCGTIGDLVEAVRAFEEGEG
jgi:hypothetical protein